MIARLKAAGIVALVVAVVAGMHFARIELEQVERYQVDPRAISAELAPDRWVDQQFLSSIEVEGFPGMQRRSVFDPRLLADSSRAIGANPWIRRVVRIERAYPSQLNVWVELRQPKGAVKLEAGFALVDRDCVLLPGKYTELPPCNSDLVVITGVEAPPPELPGTLWRCDGIATAFAVADRLRAAGIHERIQIHEIDVAIDVRLDQRMCTIIAGTNRTHVIWGKSPFSPDPVEATDTRKLENLTSLMEFYPGLIGLDRVQIAGNIATYTQRPPTAAELTHR